MPAVIRSKNKRKRRKGTTYKSLPSFPHHPDRFVHFKILLSCCQDRLAVAHERRLLEKDKQTGRCWQCEGRRTSPEEHMHTTGKGLLHQLATKRNPESAPVPPYNVIAR